MADNIILKAARASASLYARRISNGHVMPVSVTEFRYHADNMLASLQLLLGECEKGTTSERSLWEAPCDGDHEDGDGWCAAGALSFVEAQAVEHEAATGHTIPTLSEARLVDGEVVWRSIERSH